MAKKNLDAAAEKATAVFFSREDDSTTTKSTQETVKETPQIEEAPKKKKTVKKGFSFRGNPDDVIRWQNYGMAIKSTHAPSEKFCVDELWCSAIEDYIKKHPLTGKAKELYDEYAKA